jgi:type I restriction enzyme S subunit
VKTPVHTLPVGWSSAVLGKVRVDRSSSVDPSKSPREHFELYSIPAYPTGRPEVLKGKAIGSTKQSLTPGTVVVSKINPRINRVWVVGNYSKHPKIGSSEWIAFFPVEGINPHYLAYYLRQDAFRNYLAANVSGVGGSLMRVRPATLDPYPIVIAPCAEQHRIVEAIDSYFTRLDDAVTTLERVQRNLKRYGASVLKAAVEGRLVPTEAELARAEGRGYEPASVLLGRILAERRRRWEEAELVKMKVKGKVPKDDGWKARYEEPSLPDRNGLAPDGWTWTTLEALTCASRLITYGILMPKDNVPDGVPFVKVRDMRSGVLNVATLQRTAHEIAAKYPRTVLKAGDLLLAIRGTYGRVVDVPPELEGGNITQDSARLDLLPGVNRRFAKWFLLSSPTQNYFKRVARGVAVKGVNIADVRRTPVALPPLAEQDRIVEEIEDLLSIEEAHEDTIVASRARLGRLRQSILKWAFEGRLVDQDPTDEPASALLESICSERASSTAEQPKRATRRKARSKNA